jgi:hypothetical protein
MGVWPVGEVAQQQPGQQDACRRDQEDRRVGAIRGHSGQQGFLRTTRGPKHPLSCGFALAAILDNEIRATNLGTKSA